MANFNQVLYTLISILVPGSPPTNFSGFAIDDQSVNISWLPPQIPNGQIIGYKVQYNEESKDIMTYINISTPLANDNDVPSHFIVDGLKSATNYHFAISAVTIIGEGIYSSPIQIRTNDAQSKSFYSTSDISKRILTIAYLHNYTYYDRDWIYRNYR